MSKVFSFVVALGCVCSQMYGASDASGPATTAQRLFDAMASRDANAARALFMPEATLVSLRVSGAPAVTPAEKWIEHIGTAKDQLLERMWNPTVLERGGIAVVWAPYDFHLNGKFHHCGIDSFSLLKVDGSWKISGISYTSETA